MSSIEIPVNCDAKNVQGAGDHQIISIILQEIINKNGLAQNHWIVHISNGSLNPQSPQAIICLYVGAAALVHFRPGGPGLPNRGFKCNAEDMQCQI